MSVTDGKPTEPTEAMSDDTPVEAEPQVAPEPSRAGEGDEADETAPESPSPDATDSSAEDAPGVEHGGEAPGNDDDPFAGLSEKERAWFELFAKAPESPRYGPCPECLGQGYVRTGSEVSEEHALIACEGCAGKGYVAKTPPAGQVLAAPVGQEPPAPGMIWNPQLGMWAYPTT